MAIRHSSFVISKDMTATFTSFKSHFAALREWEPNPILVKELRQAVRSRILISMLMFFLGAIFLASVASLTRQVALSGDVLQMGRNMFDACLAVLSISTLVFIPLYTGIRVALEKHQSDLILFTPLPVTKLVQGKVLGGMYIAALFFSVCMPFMMVCTLLRGLDWLTIQFVLLVLFATIGAAVLAAIAVAVLPVPVFVKFLFGAAYVGGLIVACGLLLLFLFGVVQSGAAPLLHSANFWDGLPLPAGVVAFVAMVSYGFSLSFIVTHRDPEVPNHNHSQVRQYNG